MYVQLTKQIIQALDFISDDFEIEISTGKNDTVFLKVFFPKADTNRVEIADKVVTLIERFGARQELIRGIPVIWDRGGYYIHFFKLQSERIGI